GSHWGAYNAKFEPRPAALAISLFSQHFGEKKLSYSIDHNPTFDISARGQVPSLKGVPYLSTYVSKNDQGNKLYLMAINKHSLADMRSDIIINNAEVKNEARVYTLNGPSLHAKNETREEVKITESKINNASNNFFYTFPAHSVTVIEIDYNLEIEETPPAPPPVGGPPQGEQVTTPSQIVTAPGPGGGPHVRSFDRYGTPTMVNFFAFASNFHGGVSVAYSDINGDGQKEIVTGAGPGGGPHIRAFRENGEEVINFFPFHPNFRGGINIATGDVNGDGRDEIAV
ncbi:unnamed protein product, partial [marine sediment metagenome]